MLTLDMLRRLVSATEPQRDAYAVAAGSAALLEADPGDQRAAMQYLRALAALGLGDAAQRFFAALGPNIAPELQGFATALTAAPAGLIPWTSRRWRFQANLRALAERITGACSAQSSVVSSATVADLTAAWELHGERYALHQASDGNFQIMDLQQPAPWKAWLGGFDDHKAAATTCRLDDTKNRLPAPLAFDGIGYGWLLPHILTATQNSFLNYSCAAYVVEPDPVAFCLALHLHDLQNWLAHPRLRVYIGANALPQLVSDLERNADWSLPKVFIANRLSARPAVNIEAAIAPIVTARQTRRERLCEEIADHYHTIDVPAWHRRFTEAAASGPPLRVLGITTRFSTVLQYSMDELRTAVLASGHDMRITTESDDHSVENDYLGRIAEYKPDLLMILSRMRYEIPNLPKNIPLLTWDQDNLPGMREPAAGTDLNALTYVAGHGALFGFMNLGWPKRNCIFLPAAAATHRYAPQAFSPSERDRYSCDFSFISNASGTPESLRDSLAAQWATTPALPLFAQASQRIIDSMTNPVTWDNFSIPTLIQSVGQSINLALAPQALHNMHMNLATIADRCFRHTALSWVARWCREENATLKLYGTGWENHPVFKPHAAGPAAPGDEVRAICQATKINLQLMGTGFMHSRFLDGVAAGGFFLVHQGYTPDFEPPLSRELHEMAIHVMEAGLKCIREIEQSDDPVIRRVWPQYVATKLMRDEAELFRNLTAWREIRPPSLSFPVIHELHFHSEATFRARAERFLADEPLRQEITAALRRTVQDEYSYEAAFRRFIAHIQQGLTL